MPKASTVKHGDGREVGDLSAYMRTLLLDCQQSLQSLLKQDDDLKLKLATIKLILDYGWGRPGRMAPPDDGAVDINIIGHYEQTFINYMERQHESEAEPHQSDVIPLQSGGDGLAPNGPPQPENPER